MNLLQKIQYSQYWNIGFCEQTPIELIKDKGLYPIRWLKHSYRDRWFADPFILKVTKDEIVVFVEECPIDNPKGIISEMIVDRKTMRLKRRYILLELDTHLSYPAIINHDGKTYVYPENGASGKLNIYEYDGDKHILKNPVCILEDPVADATIFKYDGRFYLTATKFPETQENAYLYVSDSLLGPFKQMHEDSYETDRRCSRQGGNWFFVNGNVFRPAQDCLERYGSALSIMKVSDIPNIIKETEFCHIAPIGKRYSLGLHTLNFKDGVCVIDAYGYYLPFWGRLYHLPQLNRCKKQFRRLFLY